MGDYVVESQDKNSQQSETKLEKKRRDWGKIGLLLELLDNTVEAGSWKLEARKLGSLEGEGHGKI